MLKIKGSLLSLTSDCLSFRFIAWEGTSHKLEFIYKNFCICSYMFKLQSCSEYSLFDAIHLLKCFSTAQSSFWTCQFWCLLVLLPFFVSPFPHQQNVSLWGLFHPGKQKKGTWGRIGWIGRVGHRGQAGLSQKLLNAPHAVRAGALVNHPSWNGQMCCKILQKNSLKLNAASHNNASWYTNTDGLLEHSPSRASLYYKGPAFQKVLLFFWGPPHKLISTYSRLLEEKKALQLVQDCP